MSGRTFHVALSVDVDRFDDSTIEQAYLPCATFDDGSPMTVEAFRELCAEMRAKGFEVFPPCDNTEPDGRCAGHEKGDDAGQEA